MIVISNKIKVAFICVHNSCRSQIAEAISKIYANDVFTAYSAGTELKDRINQDAVRLIKKRYNYDMELTQKSKLIKDIPDVNYVITMGCNVSCPNIKCEHIEDWGLDDPTGKSDEVFNEIIDVIENKVLCLKNKIKHIKKTYCENSQ